MALHVRKERAGNTSLGHSWPQDGAVVEIPDEHAHELVQIRDGGFSIVAAPEPKPKAAALKRAETPAE